MIIFEITCRLKAIESEHQESLVKFKAKFLQDTEDEVTKAVEKLKRDEQTKIQNLMSEFRKREEIKVAEAVDAERKLFEREFGNLTDLHKVRMILSCCVFRFKVVFKSEYHI